MTDQQATMFNALYGFWPPGFGPDSKPAWQPTFESGVVTDGVQQWQINTDYLATSETAAEIMRRFGPTTSPASSTRDRAGFSPH